MGECRWHKQPPANTLCQGHACGFVDITATYFGAGPDSPVRQSTLSHEGLCQFIGESCAVKVK